MGCHTVKKGQLTTPQKKEKPPLKNGKNQAKDAKPDTQQEGNAKAGGNATSSLGIQLTTEGFDFGNTDGTSLHEEVIHSDRHSQVLCTHPTESWVAMAEG